MAPTAHRDLIVIGASAGGVEALRSVVGGLPADLEASVFVVLHIPARAPSALPAILGRAGPLPAGHATNGEVPAYGRIYVAPADHHLLLINGRMRLSRGPEENGHRPAIDPLFRSAARFAGSRVVGVVLSGSRDDGVAGLATIVAAGGVAVVQDPADALHPSMPQSALAQVDVAWAAPATKLGPRLADLVAERLPDDSSRVPADAIRDAEVDMADLQSISTADLPVEPSALGCPACGGALFEISDQPVLRYRCRVGHAWSASSLLDEHGPTLESALWTALRALEERAALGLRMAQGRITQGSPLTAARYRAMADEAHQSATLIRELITQLGDAVQPLGDDPPGADARAG
jgi:two-component system, chemotaxis family, protein-glutamate methylesterase/glutaminase